MAIQSSDVVAGNDAKATEYNNLRADVLTSHHREPEGTPIDQADIIAGKSLLTLLAQTFTGIKTFLSIPVLPASDPTTDNQATRKKYVDDNVDDARTVAKSGTFSNPSGGIGSTVDIVIGFTPATISFYYLEGTIFLSFGSKSTSGVSFFHRDGAGGGGTGSNLKIGYPTNIANGFTQMSVGALGSTITLTVNAGSGDQQSRSIGFVATG